MKYILKNLRSFIRTERMIFLLILLCVVTSSFIIIFSYGLYYHYNKVKELESSKLVEISIDINDSTKITKSAVKECILSIPEKTNKKVNMYLVTPDIEPFSFENGIEPLWVRFTVRDGKIAPCAEFFKNLQIFKNWIGGNYFSAEQEANGECVAIAHEIKTIDPENCVTTSLISRKEGKDIWLMIGGKEYRVIGYNTLYSTPLIPFGSLDDNVKMTDHIYVNFGAPVTRSQYDDVKAAFVNFFGDAVNVPELDIPDEQNYALYNTIIIISVLIAVIAAVNFAFLYKYILAKRSKTLAVFRLCGCTRSKVFFMFIGECMSIAEPLFIFVALMYHKLILPLLKSHFEHIGSAYNIKLYLMIFGIYTASTITVLSMILLGTLRKNIKDAKE